MADLLTELERFEAEMKELAADTPSEDVPPSSTAPIAPLAPVSSRPPPPPPPPAGRPARPPMPPFAPGIPPGPPPPFSMGQGSAPIPPQSDYMEGGRVDALGFSPQQQLILQLQYKAVMGTPAAKLAAAVQLQAVQQQQQSSRPLLPPPPPNPPGYASDAHQLFQRDAAHLSREALEGVKAALASGEGGVKYSDKKRAVPRAAAGATWEDSTLTDFPEDDHRMFCGDLGNEVNDEVLAKAFTRFPTYIMSRVVRDKRTGKTKGYGFVSFGTAIDLATALKEMNGKYVGNRPIKLRKSSWKDRMDTEAPKRATGWLAAKRQKRHVLHK